MKNNDIDIFFCVTPYHVYITLLMIATSNNKINSVIVLNANDKQIYDEFEKIEQKLLIDNYKVIRRFRNRKKEILGLEKVDRVRLYNTVDSFFQKNIKNKYNFYNFAWNLEYVYTSADIFYKNSQNVYLMEEGVATYTINTNIVQLKLKTLLGGLVDFYNDKKVVCIYVQYPERYPDKWNSKLCKFIPQNMVDKLTLDQKKSILKILMREFYGDNTKDQYEEVGIIYTQPLSEDGCIREVTKLSYYQQMYHYYSKYGNVIIKLHPRDKSNYNFFCDNILPGCFPSEVLALSDIKFKFAVSISSSAVFTTNADIKLNINQNFNENKKFYLKPLENRDL